MTRRAGEEVAGGAAACQEKLPSFSRRGWGWLMQVTENEQVMLGVKPVCRRQFVTGAGSRPENARCAAGKRPFGAPSQHAA